MAQEVIRVEALVIGERSRWLRRRHPARSAEEEGAGGRARQAGRDLPERRLHPVEGADQRVEVLRQVPSRRRHRDPRRQHPPRHGQAAVVEGRGRHQADQRRAPAAEVQRLRLPHRDGAADVAQHRRAAEQGRQRHHPGRQHRPGHRVAADRDPGLQVRRAAHRRFDRRAGFRRRCRSASWSWAAATSASRSARCTRSSAPR